MEQRVLDALNLSRSYEARLLGGSSSGRSGELPAPVRDLQCSGPRGQLTDPHPPFFHPAVPAVVVAGFLGAGKTTVVQHLLRNRGDLRLAVIVNEVGEVDLDSQLVNLAQVGLAGRRALPLPLPLPLPWTLCCAGQTAASAPPPLLRRAMQQSVCPPPAWRAAAPAAWCTATWWPR
jgi:hypothetical protein